MSCLGVTIIDGVSDFLTRVPTKNNKTDHLIQPLFKFTQR